MTRTLAIANQKGGVGKTTTAINLAAALVQQRQRVLLVDLDPQGNASVGIGVILAEGQLTSWDWLENNCSMSQVVTSVSCGVDVIPSDRDLTAVELALLNAPDRTTRLRDKLHGNVSLYDYLLIDCPPALNVLTINALMASTGVLIPMQCEYFALEGLVSLLDTLEGIRTGGNPGLETDGLLRTMYDPRNALTNQVSRQLFEHFDAKVYRTVIPRNVRLAEAPSHGLPVSSYDRRARGSAAYQALATEMLQRHQHASRAQPA